MRRKRNVSKRLALILPALMTCLVFSGCTQRQDVELAYDVVNTTAEYLASDVYAGEAGTEEMFASGLCVGGVENSAAFSAEIYDDAETAAVFLPDDGEVAFAKNIYAKRYPASTTKVLTAYLALKYGDMDQSVTVSASALEGLGTDSSLCHIQAGDCLTLRDLLYGLLLESGNDAANVIAETISGSTEAFARLMNEEAAALGATRSHFVNAHGLPDPDHYTTAYDLYLIFSAAIEYDEFVEIISTSSYTVSYVNAAGEAALMDWTNSNGYLSQAYEEPGGVTVIGGKTGTTDAAGSCLVLLSVNESGEPVISIVMRGNNHDDLYECMSYILSDYAN